MFPSLLKIGGKKGREEPRCDTSQLGLALVLPLDELVWSWTPVGWWGEGAAAPTLFPTLSWMENHYPIIQPHHGWRTMTPPSGPNVDGAPRPHYPAPLWMDHRDPIIQPHHRWRTTTPPPNPNVEMTGAGCRTQCTGQEHWQDTSPSPLHNRSCPMDFFWKKKRISAWGANSSGCLRPGLSAQECQKDNTALDTRKAFKGAADANSKPATHPQSKRAAGRGWEQISGRRCSSGTSAVAEAQTSQL